MSTDTFGLPPNDSYRAIDLSEAPLLTSIGPIYSAAFGDTLHCGLWLELRHCNPARIGHGAMLLTLIDLSFVLATERQTGRTFAITSVACDYIAPAPIGSWTVSKVDVLRTTKKLAFCRAVVLSNDSIVANATGVLSLDHAALVPPA